MNLEHLKKYNHIYVIGHNNPDIDTLASSILIRDILRKNNINADFAVIEGNELKNSNIKNAKSLFNEEPIEIKKDEIKNYKYFLVDHNDLNQSVKDESLVVECIDHHLAVSDLKYHYGDVSACALLIYDMFKGVYEFNDYQKKLIFWSFLSDTNFGRSSRYNEIDKKLISELGYKTNYDEYFENHFYETKINEKSFETNGYKDISLNGDFFKGTYINALSSDNMFQYKSFVENHKDNFIGMWMDFKNNKTYTFVKYNENLYELNYDYIASRATDVMPDVAKILLKG